MSLRATGGVSGDRPVLTDERTLFLRADRRQLRSLQPDHRVVVLTSDELARYREKFGLTFASRIRLVTFDRESRRGFVIWSASWSWGSFRLEERDDGDWELVPISSWVT